MGETEISWTHKPGTVGRTWNPVQGCRRISPGCEHCYAERLAARFAESGWSQGLINLKTKKWNGVARLADHKLSEPLLWRKPSTVFVNSMSDLFYDGFSNEQIAAVFGVMAACPQHTFQILTKRAKRMREWFEWLDEQIEQEAEDLSGALCDLSIHEARDVARVAFLLDRAEESAPADADKRAIAEVRDDEELYDLWPLPNVWLGVSVENQEAADERIPELLQTPAAVRFLSCEPLLGKVDLDRDGLLWRLCSMCKGSMSVPVEGGGKACPQCFDHQGIEMTGIDWVITGCESGPGARPCEAFWLRRLRDDCKNHGIAFFLKQATELMTARSVYPSKYAHRVEVKDVVAGVGSKRKPGGVIELPYLDGVQHAAFPVFETTKEASNARIGAKTRTARR